HGAVALVQGHDAAHEEVAALELGARGIDREAEEGHVLADLRLALSELVQRLEQDLERGLAAELLDQVALAVRDHPRLADRAAALADDGHELDRALDRDHHAARVA